MIKQRLKRGKQNHTLQNGITLIALIITIIVMLILVGVSVTVALNGGLFKTASKATKETVIEREKEELLSIVMGAIDNGGKVNFTKLDELILSSKTFTGTNGMYTSESGNAYTVDENRNISSAITKDAITKEEIIADLQSKSVGDKYVLNNVEYVVATKDDTTVQLIASTPVGSVTLGAGDDTVTGDNDIEIALNSYNNALEKIQAECERATGFSTLPENVTSVRNVVTMKYPAAGANYFKTTFNSDYKNSSDATLVDLYCTVDDGEAWTSDAFVSRWEMGFNVCGLLTAKWNSSNPAYATCNLLSVKSDLEFSFSSYGSIDVNGKITMENPEDFFESASTFTKGVIPILTISMQ